MKIFILLDGDNEDCLNTIVDWSTLFNFLYFFGFFIHSDLLSYISMFYTSWVLCFSTVCLYFELLWFRPIRRFLQGPALLSVLFVVYFWPFFLRDLVTVAETSLTSLSEPGHHAAVDPAGSQKEERHQRDGQRLSPGDAEEELCQRALRAARAEGGRRLEPQDRGRVRGPRGQPRAGGRGQSGAGEQGSAGDHDPADAPGPRGRQEAGASRRGRRQRSAVADADERQRHPRREGRRQAGHGEEVGVHRPKFTREFSPNPSTNWDLTWKHRFTSELPRSHSYTAYF